MGINIQKSGWKVILALLGMLILSVTMYYSTYLASELEKKEVWQAELHALAVESFNDESNLDRDMLVEDRILDLDLEEKDINRRIPVILEADNGDLSGSFWGVEKDTNQVYLKNKVAEFLSEGKEPKIGRDYFSKIYYFNTPLLKKIQLFPIAQISLVGLFIALGYFLFSSARTSEQNRIWAGMAKETAHQLGTPISAIIGWIENLKLISEDSPDKMEIVSELSNDVKRLELIADRFSKIGSTPELEIINLYEELNECKDYMMRRSPKRVNFHFPDERSTAKYVLINKHLFDWVIENLIRNALDAMDREGKISATVYNENNYVCIDLSDTGKGMPASLKKKVFEPGFSTKQRGWGLGLSLSKRIIKDYHKGKIYVKSSKLNEGTTFTIKLPQIT